MRTGVRSTAWTFLTGRSRRRLRKKEKKKIDKVRFFYSPRTRDATRVLSDASTRCPCARLECAHLERSRLDPSPAAGARHDRVPQVPRQLVLVCALIKMPRRLLNLRVDLVHPTHWLICAQVLELGQGRVAGEAQARGRGRRADGPDPAHRAGGVAARPLVLDRRRRAPPVRLLGGWAARGAAVGPPSVVLRPSTFGA